MDVVERITEIAKKKNITGVNIGNLLGLKKSPLTDWKNGKSKPTLEQIMIICEKFAISADYLLFGTCGARSLERSELVSNEIELINTYRQLGNKEKHEIHSAIYRELEGMKNVDKELKSKESHAG